MKFIKYIAFIITLFCLAFIAYQWYGFYQWKNKFIGNIFNNSKVIQLPNGDMEYSLINPKDTNVVMLLHGSPGNYQFGNRELSKKFQLLSLSRPGYYRSSFSLGKTPEEQADAYAILLDSLHIKSVAVIGTSGGGPSAIQFAIKYPQKCKALILEEALTKKINLTPEKFVDKIVDKLTESEFGLWLIRNMFVDQIQSYEPNDTAIEGIVNNCVQFLYPMDLTKEGYQNDIFQFENLAEYDLSEINCPTLIIHGTNDVNVPYEHALYASNKIKNAKLQTFKGDDHFLFIYRRNELLEIYNTFLNSCFNVEKN